MRSFASAARAATPTTEPPQVYGSKPIEIAWTAAPALIVFVLVLVTTRTLWEVNVTPPQPRPGDHALFVTVVGRQWWWEYRYDHYDGQELGFITANELHIPASAEGVPRPVYLTLKSADVCHSFWVPRLAGKTDLIPGRTNSHVVSDGPARAVPRAVCRVLRHPARQHAPPRGRRSRRGLRALAGRTRRRTRPPKDTDRKRSGRPEGVPRAVVRQLPPGARHAGEGHVCPGPDAPDEPPDAGLGDDARTRPRTCASWVADPQKIKPGCLMPAFGLSDRDRDRHRRATC